MDAPTMTLGLRPAQVMTVLPQQIVFAELLGQAAGELTETIERELAANPALIRVRGTRQEPLHLPLAAASVTSAGDLPAPGDRGRDVLLEEVVAELPGTERGLADY